MQLNDLTCLVVEDNEQAQRLIKLMLRDIGVTQVYTAADGREAQGYLDSGQADVDMIIADWDMPRMSGLELLRQVRMSHKTLPFLMVTANRDRDAVLVARKLGVNSYVVKPYSVETLEKKIRQLSAQI